jgi:hypothetical protein
MPQLRFEPTIPVFERAKTFYALDRETTVIGVKKTSDRNLSRHLYKVKVISNFQQQKLYISIEISFRTYKQKFYNGECNFWKYPISLKTNLQILTHYLNVYYVVGHERVNSFFVSV